METMKTWERGLLGGGGVHFPGVSPETQGQVKLEDTAVTAAGVGEKE